MENASEALIMAGEILVFIIALTVCITSFNTVKTGLEDIIGSTETRTLVKNSSSNQYVNYIESKQNNATRIVSVETVVTSMYRALKEDYTLYIKLKDYNTTNLINVDENFKTVTAEYAVKNKDGYEIISVNDEIIKVGLNEENAVFTRNINAILSSGLYNELIGKEFYEYLGEYQSNTEANSTNKDTYRIITYVEK